VILRLTKHLGETGDSVGNAFDFRPGDPSSVSRLCVSTEVFTGPSGMILIQTVCVCEWYSLFQRREETLQLNPNGRLVKSEFWSVYNRCPELVVFRGASNERV